MPECASGRSCAPLTDPCVGSAPVGVRWKSRKTLAAGKASGGGLHLGVAQGSRSNWRFGREPLSIAGADFFAAIGQVPSDPRSLKTRSVPVIRVVLDPALRRMRRQRGYRERLLKDWR